MITSLAMFRAAKELKKQAQVSFKTHDSVIARAGEALKAEQAVLEQVSAALKTQKELVKAREARLELARLQLSYTKITAPADGYVTRKSVETGNQVNAGQPVMTIVPLDDLYIVANYKETQIKRIRPGHRVKIEVDSYPGDALEGTVDSIMAGTGAVFSIFPPENATGNYVKVVQRIPVKIVLEKNPDSELVLRLGMSVSLTVLAKK